MIWVSASGRTASLATREVSGALAVGKWHQRVRQEHVMIRPIARDPIYRRWRFEAEIIESCVCW
jgi:hypothetical protein